MTVRLHGVPYVAIYRLEVTHTNSITAFKVQTLDSKHMHKHKVASTSSGEKPMAFKSAQKHALLRQKHMLYSCTHWLRPRNSPSPPAFGLIYEGAIGQPR
jgi:hypothetical protein